MDIEDLKRQIAVSSEEKKQSLLREFRIKIEEEKDPLTRNELEYFYEIWNDSDQKVFQKEIITSKIFRDYLKAFTTVFEMENEINKSAALIKTLSISREEKTDTFKRKCINYIRSVEDAYLLMKKHSIWKVYKRLYLEGYAQKLEDLKLAVSKL